MNFRLFSPLYALLLAIILVSGCEKEYETIEEIDQRNIKEYIQKNNLSSLFRDTLGVSYQIITPGTGALLNYTDQVFATFSIKSLDNSFNLEDDGLNRYSGFLGYFSRERGNAFPEAFSSSVKEILKRKGGTIRVIIPSHNAYGRSGYSSLKIPGNASLDCVIKVYDVNNKTEFEDIFVKKYISDNNITGLTRLNSGLYYKIITQGTGTEAISSTSTLKVSYTGKLTTGTVFETSTSLETSLTGIIPGWVEGLSKTTKGGKIRLIIPPSLAYGEQGKDNIGPYSILDFDIEVLEVTN